MLETAQPTAAPAPPPSIQLMQMISGSWLTQCLGVAAELGVADQLAAGPKPVSAIARACDAHPEGLYRLMRALASVGVFVEEPGADPKYGLTPLGELLRRDVPGSMRDVARMMSFPAHWNSWGHLLDAIRTNEPVFGKAMGVADVFTYLHGDRREAEAFNGAMTGISAVAAEAVAQAYDFTRFGTIVDVGGGHGALLAALLRSAPTARGVLFDLPAVIASLPSDGPLAATRERVETVAGDFFAAVPGGGDAYVMKHILHDWSDERSIAILRAIRAVIRPDGVLAIVEMVVPPHSQPDLSKLMDLNMLVMTPGGKERTAEQWERLLADGGFRLGRIVPTASPYCVIEGLPA